MVVRGVICLSSGVLDVKRFTTHCVTERCLCALVEAITVKLIYSGPRGARPTIPPLSSVLPEITLLPLTVTRSPKNSNMFCKNTVSFS